MSVVKINAINVTEGQGPLLEEKFKHRKHIVDNLPGFEGFKLLRPVAGESRYFVFTQWASEADFQTWANMRNTHNTSLDSSGTELLEFEIVELD